MIVLPVHIRRRFCSRESRIKSEIFVTSQVQIFWFLGKKGQIISIKQSTSGFTFANRQSKTEKVSDV